MALTLTDLNRGTTPGDGTGDTAYVGAGKINTNNGLIETAVNLTQDLSQNEVLGRITAGTGDVEQLTAAQLRDVIESAGAWDLGNVALTTTGDIRLGGLYVNEADTGAGFIEVNSAAASGWSSIEFYEVGTLRGGLYHNTTFFIGEWWVEGGTKIDLLATGHAGAGGIAFYSQDTLEGEYHAVNQTWDFKTNDITTTGNISADGATINGARTDAGIIDVDAALGTANFSGVQFLDAGTLHAGLYAGNATNTASVSLYLSNDTFFEMGNANNASPGDIWFYSISNLALRHDASASLWTFNDNDITTTGDIKAALLSTNNTDPIAFAYSQTPAVQTHETATVSGGVGISSWSTAANGSAALMFVRSKGATIGTHTAVADGDSLGYLTWVGSNGTNFTGRDSALIEALVDGTPAGSGAWIPGELMFYVNNGSGSYADQVFAIKAPGNLNLIRSFTVGNLPTGAVGDITRVTDASAPSVGSTVSAGGAAAALVWYNGSNWTVIGV